MVLTFETLKMLNNDITITSYLKDNIRNENIWRVKSIAFCDSVSNMIYLNLTKPNFTKPSNFLKKTKI